MWLALGVTGFSQTATAPSKSSEAKTKSTTKTAGKNGTADIAAAAMEQTNNGLKAFGDMIPLGLRNKGVRIPAFEEGKPSSLITADWMTRVDDNRLFGEQMRIHLFGAAQPEDVHVDLNTGTYNMDNQVLSSNERSKVTRSDFKIEGDGLVFDTKTSQGKMVGNVKMTIYDAKAFNQSMTPGATPADQAAAKPGADAKAGPLVNDDPNNKTPKPQTTEKK
jgi:hypothetical protein